MKTKKVNWKKRAIAAEKELNEKSVRCGELMVKVYHLRDRLKAVEHVILSKPI